MIRSAVSPIVSLACAAFALAAFAADSFPEKQANDPWQRSSESVKVLLDEAKKFDSSHKLKGQAAGPALRQMQEEGYGCDISYLNVPELEPGGVLPRMVQTPFVFRNRPSS